MAPRERTRAQARWSGVRTLLGGAVGAPLSFFIGIWLGGAAGITLYIGSILLGAMCLVKGIDRLYRAASLPAASSPPELEGHRRSEGPSVPQVAGRRCAACEEKILVADQGKPCPDCAVPVHVKCLPKHVASHGPNAGPFR